MAFPSLGYRKDRKMEKDFMYIAGETLANMRLVAEGARTLFENELSPLYGFLLRNDKAEQALALDTIGTALATLQQKTHDLQTAHAAEVKA